LAPNRYRDEAVGEPLSLLLTGGEYYHEIVGRHDCHGWGKGADVGVGHKAVRKRAVGTRERIIAYLTEAGELFDANGMASTQLAAAVGYPGSSVAFAQLLSGMERSGLIDREVRGKRTYRIRLGPARTAGPAQVPSGVPGGRVASAVPGVPGISAVGAAGPGAAGFDYDELARRLLVQVVRRLAASDAEAGTQDRSALAETPAEPDQLARSDQPAQSDQLALSEQLALQETVSGLEYELATAWTKHGKLAEENVRLREQLRAAQRSLALAAEQVRRLPAGTDLNDSEVVLLQRLLTSAPAADSTDDSGAEAASLLG
jgi:hypothetical protein